jgi:hypothetical protein
MKMVEKTKVKYPRAPVKWYVSARASGREIEGVTKNISTRQAYICCSKPPRLNEALDIVFTTPEREIEVHAEVVWSNAYGRDDEITPRGMGVRFVKISEEDKKFLDDVVKEYDVGKIAAEYLDTLKTEISDN